MLAKSEPDTIEFLTSTALIDSHINYDEFVLVNDVLTEYNDIKEAIKTREI